MGTCTAAASPLRYRPRAEADVCLRAAATARDGWLALHQRSFSSRLHRSMGCRRTPSSSAFRPPVRSDVHLVVELVLEIGVGALTTVADQQKALIKIASMARMKLRSPNGEARSKHNAAAKRPALIATHGQSGRVRYQECGCASLRACT